MVQNEWSPNIFCCLITISITQYYQLNKKIIHQNPIYKGIALVDYMDIIIILRLKVMKSALLFFIVFLLPFSTWAMTPLTDSELSDVSGQAGVSIMPNINMDIYIGVIAWGDTDGLGASNIWGEKTTGGYAGVTNFNITNLYIGPRTDYYGYNGSYPITIDGATIISHTVDDSYIRMDLSTLQNPLMTLNTRLH
jgi:hypothetical protein